MMRGDTVSERVRARLRELGDSQPRGFRTKVAKKLGWGMSTLTPYLSGASEPPLDVLKVICETADPKIRLPELLAEPGAEVRELDADEAAILRALRRWPASVTRALAQFVAFFADEEPVGKQTRNMHELWRRLDSAKRARVYGYALSESESQIPPDIAAEFFDRLSDESKAAVGMMEDQRAKRRRKA